MDNKALVQELELTKAGIEKLESTKTKLELYNQNLEDQKAGLIAACEAKGLPTKREELELFIKSSNEHIEVQSIAVKNALAAVTELQDAVRNELGIK